MKEDFGLIGFSMKQFYSTEAAMLVRVLIYNLFVLFRYEILGQKEKIERLKTMRYNYAGTVGRRWQKACIKDFSLYG